MAQYGERTAEFADHMSDAEALMWNVEKDPWLSSTIGTVVVTDRPLDFEQLWRRIRAAAAGIDRLRSRAVPRLGRLSPPSWQPDPEFDLGYHVRRLALPAPGDRAALLELAARLIEDPFDRTRPLWQFFAVEGLADGGGALIVKLHHSVTDGVGAIRLAEQYMDLTRQAPAPPEVDLDAIVAADAAAHRAGDRPRDPSSERSEAAPGHGADGSGEGQGSPSWSDALLAALNGAGQAAKVPAELARRWAGDAMVAMADPARFPEMGESALASLRGGFAQLDPNGPGAQSPLWGHRSRRRTLRTLDLPFAPLKAAAKAAGVSLNDVFVAGAAAAAGEYHAGLGLPLDQLTVSFVVSTRHGEEVAGNAFSPIKATIPTGIDTTVEGHVRAVHEVLAARRAEVGGGNGLLASLAGAVNLLPTSVVTRLARAQASSIDLATSNVRAAPIAVYIAGAEVLATYPIGPVAATACNVTLMSYRDGLFIGAHIDPVAVSEPERLMQCLRSAYDRIIALAPADHTDQDGAEKPRSRRAPATKRKATAGRSGAAVTPPSTSSPSPSSSRRRRSSS